MEDKRSSDAEVLPFPPGFDRLSLGATSAPVYLLCFAKMKDWKGVQVEGPQARLCEERRKVI